MSQLDPVIDELLQGLAQLDLTPIHQLEPEAARAGMKAMVPEVEPLALQSVDNVEMQWGDARIPARVYRPTDDADLPCLVFFHGGGWVVCDLDTHDDVCRQMASKAECVVISVDYRLAPESKYPAAMDDAYASVCWVAENAVSLGIDSRRIAVGGDSAGGNLAAAVTIRIREEGGPALCYQTLWYPVTNIDQLTTKSYGDYATGYRLEKKGMEWFKGHYFSDAKHALYDYASPLLAESLQGLPPAYVMTAGFDVLRDEGESYALKLHRDGVKVTYECFDSLIHGFMNMGAIAPAAQQAVDRVAKDLRSAFWE